MTDETTNEILDIEEIEINESTNSNISTEDYIPQPDCLALTVRKDYNLVIVKNIFKASGRMSWKVALTTFIINFINLLF